MHSFVLLLERSFEKQHQPKFVFLPALILLLNNRYRRLFPGQLMFTPTLQTNVQIWYQLVLFCANNCLCRAHAVNYRPNYRNQDASRLLPLRGRHSLFPWWIGMRIYLMQDQRNKSDGSSRNFTTDIPLIFSRYCFIKTKKHKKN